MSEENLVASPETPAESVENKIAKQLGKVDAFVDKIVGIVGARPWEKWLGICNDYISRFLPAAIALAGVASFVVGLVVSIKYDMPVSVVIATLAILVLTAFSMHLAPKALSLSRSFVEKGEAEVMRPEFIYINKVLLGIGGLLAAICLLLRFDSDLVVPALVIGIVALIAIVVYSNPGMVGVKEGYPKNVVEELITISMFPVKIFLALLTPIIGLAVVGGVVYGVIEMFNDGITAATVFLVTALLPFALPMIAYFLYLVLMFLFDFYRAMVSIPRRLEDVRKAIAEK